MMHQRYCQCSCGCRRPYLAFGHWPWGEPYSRATHCYDCDVHFASSGLGLEGLGPEKQDLGQWLDSDGSSADLAKATSLLLNSNYAIKNRLIPAFFRALRCTQLSSSKNPPCENDFFLAIEVGTHWVFNENSGGYELDHHNYHPLEHRWVIDPLQLNSDVDGQGTPCPCCGEQLHLMVHEGWASIPSVGYGRGKRAVRVFYLSCCPDWQKYVNRPVRENSLPRANQGPPMPPFNDHPAYRGVPWISFWADRPASPPR